MNLTIFHIQLHALMHAYTVIQTSGRYFAVRTSNPFNSTSTIASLSGLYCNYGGRKDAKIARHFGEISS